VFTVLGASGFIGSHLTRHLVAAGAVVQSPQRGEPLSERSLGTVFYCIGLTANFRQNPFETVEAHVHYLSQVLRTCEFDSLIYLSSTRLYKGLESASEASAFRVIPSNPDDLFNASKILGESLGASSGRPFKVVRLSNVYGPDVGPRNFLGSLIEDAVRLGAITLATDPSSTKDYVAVGLVAELLTRIATTGRHEVYNVASGRQVRAQDVVDRLQALTGCTVEVKAGAPLIVYPEIDVRRIKEEFAFQAQDVLDDLGSLVESVRQRIGIQT
jgi:nucleoside-diphosphate-sugar epimerase